MAARRHVQRAVFGGHIADHQQRGNQVIVAVRCEEKVLMPLHLSRGVRQLGVDLTVMKTGAVAADQLRRDGCHA